jgi:hypothetical protein
MRRGHAWEMVAQNIDNWSQICRWYRTRVTAIQNLRRLVIRNVDAFRVDPKGSLHNKDPIGARRAKDLVTALPARETNTNTKGFIQEKKRDPITHAICASDPSRVIVGRAHEGRRCERRGRRCERCRAGRWQECKRRSTGRTVSNWCDFQWTNKLRLMDKSQKKEGKKSYRGAAGAIPPDDGRVDAAVRQG